MSYTKIWVHAVWGTKGRQPIMANGLRKAFLDHIISGAAEKEIEIGLINCWVDHVHCLIRLKTDQNIEDVIKQIRTESNQWIRRNQLPGKRFTWAREYFAASVSEGNLEGARNYILSQERYHAHRTYHEEIQSYFAGESSTVASG